jgi:UDP-glucose 4-epimerase
MNPNPSTRPWRWLITGGCGFIGTCLVKRLISDSNIFIRILDNLSVGTRDDLSRVCRFTEVGLAGAERCRDLHGNEAGIVELVVGDIRDERTSLSAAAGTDVIVHLAANTGVGPSVDDPRLDMNANVVGTFNMLEAARQAKVKRFIFASSGAPVGECEPPIHEDLAPHPVSPYGASKLAGEGYCSAYWRTFGIETVALRFGNVYGPGSGHKNSIVAKFIRQAIDGDPCEIYGDGTQTRDFIYIDDLVAAILAAAQVPDLGGEVFQIATSKEHTINEVADRLKMLLAEHAGLAMAVRYGASRRGDVRRNYSNTTKAKKRLNWTAQTDLTLGLKNTILFFSHTRKP